MITYIQCVKSKAELSIQEFRDRWEKYGRLAEALADESGAVGLFMNTTLQVEENLEVRLNRGTAERFDGVLKFCWRNAAGLDEILQQEEPARLLEELRSHQDEFMDLDRSSFFFASQQPLRGATLFSE